MRKLEHPGLYWIFLTALLPACATTPPTTSPLEQPATTRAAPAPAAPAPPAPPPPPYYSIQLSSNAELAQATAVLESVAEAPAARIEKRGIYYAIRVGAWPTRKEAERARPEFLARGFKGASILRIANTVPWTSPSTASANVADAGNSTPPEAAPVIPAAAPDVPAAASGRPLLPKTDPSLAEQLESNVREMVRNHGAARRDGFLYGSDIGRLLLFAAQRKDRWLYDALLPEAKKLIVNQSDDPFTQGFVLWRYKSGVKPEVSGSWEAIWMARALWSGAEAFNRPADRALALRVLDGYAQHATELQGIWMVRKYFDFTSRTFVNLSSISAYFPDFLDDVGRKAARADLRDIASRSFGLLERSVAPSGLLYPLVQPEIDATYPGMDLDIYAPNDIVPLPDACWAAEGALRGRPKIAEGILDFVKDEKRHDRAGRIVGLRLFAYYTARDGVPVGKQTVLAPAYACLARLASATKERGLLKGLKPRLDFEMTNLVSAAQLHMQAAPLYIAAPLLLAAEAMGEFPRQ